MESLHKNIQLKLEFLKDPFLVLKFYYYTLIDRSNNSGATDEKMNGSILDKKLCFKLLG